MTKKLIIDARTVQELAEHAPGVDLRGSKVATPAMLSRASVVACADFWVETPFTDNVFTTCATCGVGIQHRPYVPPAAKKLCRRCAGLGPDLKPLT